MKQYQHFLDVFYNGLFHPVTLYEKVADEETPPNHLLFYGLLFVLAISAMTPVVVSVLDGSGPEYLLFDVPFRGALGLVIWFSMTGSLSLMAHAFTGDGRFKTLLTLFGFSSLPWVLLAPLMLFRGPYLGLAGDFLVAASCLVFWVWNLSLFVMAISKTYRLSLDRVLIILSVVMTPFAFFFLTVSWLAGFFVNLRHFFQ